MTPPDNQPQHPFERFPTCQWDPDAASFTSAADEHLACGLPAVVRFTLNAPLLVTTAYTCQFHTPVAMLSVPGTTEMVLIHFHDRSN
jgi:hypothetical protein